jgi:hypothetical protein
MILTASPLKGLWYRVSISWELDQKRIKAPLGAMLSVEIKVKKDQSPFRGDAVCRNRKYTGPEPL